MSVPFLSARLSAVPSVGFGLPGLPTLFQLTWGTTPATSANANRLSRLPSKLIPILFVSPWHAANTDSATVTGSRHPWRLLNHPYKADTKLLPSGLLGPVRLLAEDTTATTEVATLRLDAE